jgi:thiamine-phosphate pyrophosphorylase
MIDKLHYISQETERVNHIDAVRAALTAGCKWIQLRIKDQTASDILAIAIEAGKLCAQHEAKLIINDYPEIAVAAGAHGVHLGLDDLPIHKARQIVGHNMIIGGTANTFEHVLRAHAEGADYIGLGPFRYTATKKKLSPIIGLAGYDRIMQQLRQKGIAIPVIAIGGIETDDLPDIMRTGVHGVAISAAITHSVAPAQIVGHIYQHLKKEHYA